MNDDIKEFQKLIQENRYDFVKMLYIIFPFGQEDHALEHEAPYDWQIEELQKISKHLQDPLTRYETYRLIVSSGNGAAKTALGAWIFYILLYTQKLRARITANTAPQMTTVVWPEYDIWFQHARFHELFFEKFGTSIKAKDPKLGETWRLDAIAWNESTPASISGLHNKGHAVLYTFEEAPGIPSIIWQYARGAFTDANTIKFFLAFGNSDDPESQFEQNMESPLWNSRRLDTRELKHTDKNEIAGILQECNGNEDADDFRVRVRGLPRKTSKDSIISLEPVMAALERRKNFDRDTVSQLPVILTCDPAWKGGDETTIAMRQGPYCKLLEKYKLDKNAATTHQFTFNKMLHWERELKADQVFIDQGEGTALYTLAVNQQKTNWELVSFASNPNDVAEAKNSEYGNLRAQMYYMFDKWTRTGDVVIDSEDEQWIDAIKKQLCWTKGARHKITGKKLCETKLEIKNRVGQSPDVADVFVLTFARPVIERLPENDFSYGRNDRLVVGTQPYHMPEHPDPYSDDQGFSPYGE